MTYTPNQASSRPRRCCGLAFRLFLNHINHVLTGSAACFTDRFHRGRRRPWKTPVRQNLQGAFYRKQARTCFSSPNSHSDAAPQSRGQPIIHIRPFRKPQTLTETMPWAGQSLQSKAIRAGPQGSHTLRLLGPAKGRKGKTENMGPPQSRTRRSHKRPVSSREMPLPIRPSWSAKQGKPRTTR